MTGQNIQGDVCQKELSINSFGVQCIQDKLRFIDYIKSIGFILRKSDKHRQGPILVI